MNNSKDTENRGHIFDAEKRRKIENYNSIVEKYWEAASTLKEFAQVEAARKYAGEDWKSEKSIKARMDFAKKRESTGQRISVPLDNGKRLVAEKDAISIRIWIEDEIGMKVQPLVQVSQNYDIIFTSYHDDHEIITEDTFRIAVFPNVDDRTEDQVFEEIRMAEKNEAERCEEKYPDLFENYPYGND